MIDLDLKDWKILYELDINSRQSFHEIGKKVGLSKDSVIYRINKMQEKGIIKKFHTLIDTGKLGFISFRLYLKFQNTTPEKETEIIEFLKKQKIITWLASIEGEYNLGMWILCKSISEMNELWKKILENFRDNIEKTSFVIFSKVYYFSRNYFLNNKQQKKEWLIITEPKNMLIDEKELEIIKILVDNSRASVVEIAKKVGLTPKTIISKIKKLEREKIIIGYRTMFDLEKLNYQYFKVHFNLHNLNQEKEKKFRQFLRYHTNVIYDNEVIGGDDIEIEIQCKSIEEFRKILDQIKQQFSEIIKNYKYFTFYKEHKYIFFPTI